MNSAFKQANSARTLATKALFNNSHHLYFNSNNSQSLLFTRRQYTSFSIINKSKQNLFCNLTNNARKMSTTPVNLKLIKTFDNIVKSEKDKRLYRGLLLDNDLKCMLISDPTTDRSAASVDVHVGYMLDPKEFPGLAHFCEHMLFMGSQKVTTLYLIN